MKLDFTHHQTAHCENGVASNLLKDRGIMLSEPMVFGIGSGLFYFYFPFLKVNHAPAVSYRPMPGNIFNKLAKRLGIKIKRRKFSNRKEAKEALDANLEKGIPSGLQVGVYHLPYFPDAYRFHFNAHNIVVFGKENDHYFVSDPTIEHTSVLTADELEKVRFAQGTLAPKGHLYYPVYIPEHIDLKPAIIKALKETCSTMVAPVPIVGVKAMRWVAKDILRWVKKYGERKTNHYLAQIVRMQEEIGTGGGGFRYIFAAFLQESSELLQVPSLRSYSEEMTKIGDLWRDFAVEASRVYKKRSGLDDVYHNLSKQLLQLADLEEDFFKRLKISLKAMK